MEHSNAFETCELLLQHGADASTRDVEQKTPLHTFFNDAVSTALLDNRNMINKLDSDHDGMTVLHYAAWSSRTTPAHISHFLESQPILSNAPDKRGRRLIHLASERGNIALLNYLCEHDPASSISLLDAAGCTPMHYAARSKRVGAIDLLISKGADMNAISQNGRTILHEAAARDNIAAIEHIFELLGDSLISTVDTADYWGLTPFMLAKRCSAAKAARFLESQSANRITKSSYSIGQDVRSSFSTWENPRPRLLRRVAKTWLLVVISRFLQIIPYLLISLYLFRKLS